MSALFDRDPAAVNASGDQAIAARGNIGQAFTGAGSVGLHIDNVGLLALEACPPAESVDCPPVLTSLPYRAGLFVGRGDELSVLDEAVPVPGQALAHVLHGLGGIGKSTLAARWAAGYSTTHAPVWWITAESCAAIDAGLAGLATALQPSLATLLPQEQLAEWALRWLASHTGWLLVLDNVTTPADVTPLLSRAPSGRFLMTSRQATGWQGIAETVPLDVLSDTEAVDLFTRIRGEDPDTAELCAELGCLPLAVAQAAAYCHETDCPVREYLDDLATHPLAMYVAKDESRDHERTVARVWHITLDRLAEDPLTVRILLTLAWYAPEGIPRSLLADLGSRPAVRGALGRLAAHSMITLSGDTVSVHRLVQAVSRTEDAADRHRNKEAIEQACAAATEALARAMPRDVEDDPSAWPVMRTLLPHVEKLAEHTSPDADTEAMAGLLTRTGNFMLSAGTRLAPGALGLLRRAEASCVRLHGPDSVETLDARTRLVQARRMLLDTEQLPAVAEQTLADCERVLGTEHGTTLAARMNVYYMASLEGDPERALRLVEDVVAGCVRVFGEDHPRTFSARHNVAVAVSEVGESARAVDLAEALLADCVRVLGEEHPETLAAKSLAAMLTRQAVLPPLPAGTSSVFGRLLVAAQNDEEALVGMMRGIAEEIATLEPRQLTPATEEDVRAAERDLETCLRVLTDDHAETMVARLALIQTYMATRDERYAEPTVRVFVEMFSALGEEHPMATVMFGMFKAMFTVVKEFPETTADPDPDPAPE
ncbi:tetratricopeptide repeat protein [Streptomyces ipomoeae]|uniref:tetratricopeptide repeat protein n=1 Tax=Streptomyces ipomoeae TaxID=103232 RepID=UPI00215D5951|nr:tetratricopeptide repeat protein [Streptomyces ipomoeae]